MLQHYTFPGNVRELQNAIERAATFCDSSLIEAQHLPQRIREQTPAVHTASDTTTPAAPSIVPQQAIDVDAMPSLETVQRKYIHQVLAATQGNKRHAADILGITRRTLYRWID